jgi:hypothetical protein
MRLLFSLVLPLFRTSGKDKKMKTPKTPIEFDYDLWTTEDGKCMVRVKLTGEVTEVDREVMKLLRVEEKRLRRSTQGVPIQSGDENEDRATILSLDFVSYEGGEDMSPAWLEDPERTEDIVTTKIMEQEFVDSLTPVQRKVYFLCLRGGMSLSAYAKQNGLGLTSVRDTRDAIRKKFKKVFGGTRSF